MDPNELLSMIRARCADIKQPDPADNLTIKDLALDLVEYVENLDNWLQTGGFLPREWTKNQ